MMVPKLNILLVLVLCLGLVVSEDYDADYDWSDGVLTGDDLKIVIGNRKDKIIVTLWMNNVYEQWEQNKKNERVKGTIKNLIDKCHPHTVYAEADVSDYNRDAFTFEELAKDWGIMLDVLHEGPLVMPVYQNHGEMFWGTNQTQTISLVRAVHRYLIQVETEVWGEEPIK